MSTNKLPTARCIARTGTATTCSSPITRTSASPRSKPTAAKFSSKTSATRFRLRRTPARRRDRIDGQDAEVGSPVTGRDQFVEALDDRRQYRQLDAARLRGFEHQTRILACHHQLESRAEIALRHALPAHVDGRRRLEVRE